MHTGEKRHVCVTCGKSFCRAYHLARHKLLTRDGMCVKPVAKHLDKRVALNYTPELTLVRSLILVVCAACHLQRRPRLKSMKEYTQT